MPPGWQLWVGDAANGPRHVGKSEPVPGIAMTTPPEATAPVASRPAPPTERPDKVGIGHRSDQDTPIGLPQRIRAFRRRDHVKIARTDIDPSDRQSDAADHGNPDPRG